MIGRATALLFALACVAVTLPASAAGPSATTTANVPRLPDTLTRESARDLLSHLSDAEVRALLLEQLDRAAAPVSKPGPSKGGMGEMAGMAGVVDQHAGSMRDRYTTLFDALLALPTTLRDAAIRITQPSGGLLLLGFIALVLAAGAIVELLYRYALRGYRTRLEHAPGATFSARAFQLSLELLFDVGALAVFGIAAIVAFFALWPGDELRRIVVLNVLFVVVGVRTTALLARFLLSSTPARPRLLPLADAPARILRRSVIGLFAISGFGLALLFILRAAGAPDEASDVLGIAFWFVGLVLILWTVWSVRKPIADLIRGDRRGAVVGWIADLWPVAATAYFVTLLLGGVFNLLAGTPITSGVGLASVLLVIALPVVDMAFCRALAAGVESRRARADFSPGDALVAFEPIFRRVIHIVVVVVGLLLIARLWDLDLFAFAQLSLGGRIAGSLVSISIVVLATYMLWEILRTAIDRRLVAEGPQNDDVPATRLRTVLPILRATMFVTIVVMAAMSILAGLGVNIVPLIAGAGVVGVAIGFGSQSLVRDIVSGAFFLMDDAFRLGEYIEVGDAKGRVEKINLRSVFLRHHRGPINILPYGEIKRLRNTSRDWQVHVLEFRMPYETSMLQVKKIVKQVSDELSADEDYASDILQPVKSVGVMSMNDDGVLVRVKFTARPNNNQWVIRRVAYDKIIRAFRNAGLRFATRQVAVIGPDGQTVASGAAALAIESIANAARKKGASGAGAGE